MKALSTKKKSVGKSMGYRRVQKDLQRQKKRRNVVAASLSDPMFRKRVVESKKIKHKRRRLTKDQIDKIYNDTEQESKT
jgi:stalled ribosome alternative rescue factor ArfA